MSYKYHICKKKEKKIVGDSLLLHCQHHSKPKKFAKMVQTLVQKVAW
jgi:hypothetical protein